MEMLSSSTEHQDSGSIRILFDLTSNLGSRSKYGGRIKWPPRGWNTLADRVSRRTGRADGTQGGISRQDAGGGANIADSSLTSEASLGFRLDGTSVNELLRRRERYGYKGNVFYALILVLSDQSLGTRTSYPAIN